ncbi:MAG: AgmX/PglI C-terminal domain-containing protein, partial [Oligoflexia bacterium]|nr:AgmX/PglI C-terminal domain-containing protein [Oligoflexia bacterium]
LRAHRQDEYVITTSVRGTSRTQVWDSAQPLALGHPLRWVMERTDQGVRVRNLRGGLQGPHGGLKEIPTHDLRKGTEFDLPEEPGAKVSEKVSLKIRPVAYLRPAFGSSQGEALSIFACAGNWVIDSRVLAGPNSTYDATISGQTIFKLTRSAGDTWAILAAVDALALLSSGEKETPLTRGQRAEVTAAELANSTLSLRVEGGALRTWRFALSENPAIPASKPEHLVPEPDVEYFRLALRYSGIALAALMVVSWLWPQPKPTPQELIPPQFAKIVLTKPKTAEPAARGPKTASTAPVASGAPKKVQDAAVVQAFRARALSNAVSGLLKGGMTKLLAQSDFVEGSRHNQDAQQMFNSKSNALRASGPDTGLSGPRNVQVAGLGGGGGGGVAGYGKGQHATLKGQGGSFVTMDTGGSSVDEGLSKDEVGEVIHRHMSEVRYCYESAMIRTPDIEGKLITSFTIGGNGVVKSTEVKSSTLPDPRLDDCILRRLASWKFPNPRGGVDVAVSYPFIFKTLGR